MSKFAIRDITDVTFWKKDNITGVEKPAIFLNSLKMNTIEGTTEMVQVRGGRGNGIYGIFESNRDVKFTMQDSLFDPKMQAARFGGGVIQLSASDKEILYKREVVTIPEGSTGTSLEFTLEYTPISPSSVVAYKTLNGTTNDIELTNTDTTPPTTATEFNVTTNKIKFGDGIASASEVQVVVFYKHEISSGEKYVIDSGKFSDCVFKVTMDGFIRDVTADGCAVDVPVQVIVPRVKIMSNFKLEFKPDGEPQVFDFEVMALKPFNSTELMKIIRY